VPKEAFETGATIKLHPIFTKSSQMVQIPDREGKGWGTLSLTNKKDLSYIGEVRLGSPPQTLRCIFDTGSTNTWVRSTLSSDEGVGGSSKQELGCSRKGIGE